jgi:toxin YoeB
LTAKRGSRRRAATAEREWLGDFHPEVVDDLRFWVSTNRKVALRGLDLVDAILRDPFTGIGKPEPLKYLPPGTWSRRLTEEHRIVYLVGDGRVDFLQARYHY